MNRQLQDEFLRLQNALNKTILFVTHDFDEAIRLADRIAIMKDGVIEQIDTPANIILNPATEYVAKFTHEVPRERVLTCETIMDVPSTSLYLDRCKSPKMQSFTWLQRLFDRAKACGRCERQWRYRWFYSRVKNYQHVVWANECIR